MQDMMDFLNTLPTGLEEYSDDIVRRLVEKVIIYDEKMVVEFRSGIRIEVEE